MWRPATRPRPQFRTAYNLYHQEFKPLLKNAGLPGFTFHSLRHACATLLLAKNINPKIVQEMLDQATIPQTMDTYSHVMQVRRRAEVRAVYVSVWMCSRDWLRLGLRGLLQAPLPSYTVPSVRLLGELLRRLALQPETCRPRLGLRLLKLLKPFDVLHVRREGGELGVAFSQQRIAEQRAIR